MQLEIRGHAPELHAVPWELLCGANENRLALSADRPFSRFLVSGSGDQSAISDRPVGLLLAIANPEKLVKKLREIEGIEETVGALADLVKAQQERVVGSILPGRKPLSKELRDRLEREGWTIHSGETSWQNIFAHMQGQHILHIISHGMFETEELFREGLELIGVLDKGGDVPAALKAKFADEEFGLALELPGQKWRWNYLVTPGQLSMAVADTPFTAETDGLTVNQSTASLLLEPHPGDDAANNLGVDIVRDERIVSSLKGRSPMPQLVFLAACESAKRPETGVNAFVGLAPGW